MTDSTINAKDSSGSFSAYVASPESGTGPAIVVIQEIFGVNDNIRAVCDWLAGEGFIAIAPDLFWRMKPGIELEPKIEEEFQEALAYMNDFDGTKGMEDIQTTIDHARTLSSTNKVGAIGYCLGGHLAYMAAATTNVDASVGYYGVAIDTKLDEASKVSKPLVLHVAKEDGFVSPEAQAAMHKGLDPHPQITLYDYVGADHGFARFGGEHYHSEHAELANKRTIDLFKESL